MKKYFSLSVLLFMLTLLVSCGGSSSGDEINNGGSSGNGDGFDRKAMLTNWMDHFVIPYTQDFTNAARDLDEKIKNFNNTPNASTLSEARKALNKAYEAYQYIGFYRFGKAEEVTMNFQYRLNTYPTNTKRIKQNAVAKNYSFRKLSEISNGNIAQGLPAVDYLVNGIGENDTEIISYFTTNTNAEDYKAYLIKLTKEMLSSSEEVLADLKSNRNKFIENTSNSASGSISLVVNAYVQYYEKYLRAGKIGYPSGIITPMYIQQNTEPKPELVESQFSPQYNRSYALLGTKAMAEFFQGKGSDGTERPSLQQYIEYMSAKNNNNKTLAQEINSNFQSSEAAIQGLEPNFKVQIQKDLNQLKNAYYSLQNNVPKLKVEMAQTLNITISYMDTDGD
ncbi:imelysin family protein [Riemerella columbipharyngis]|uniref:Imelysin n=1 Tax=Riemerella columbipharyngis TaxID=1071918 RepID=A0A1G6Y8M2_9FLAO|nr:imelysin family protein [Riemerella columbipharyngis]SDD86834.1 Imelysin [Riemerella columbipharyngis]